MITNKRHFILINVILLICMLMAVNPISAQNAYEPITKIDLGVKTLSLNPGETYTFKVSYEPREPLIETLIWTVSDSSVAEVDPDSFTLTAKNPGRIRLMAESFDGNSYAVCDVTVKGNEPKDAGAQTSGKELLSLSSADRKKITSDTLNRYIAFIEDTSFTASAYKEAAGREFNILADVKPGTEKAESKRALALGMKEASPLENIHAVALQGTLEQILSFTSGNKDLLEIFGGEMEFIIDPITEEMTSESVEKSVSKLKGNAEKLSAIDAAHKMGANGEGTIIAVIDTGLDPNHEQFKGRVVAQQCFSTNGYNSPYTLRNVCGSSTSSIPSKAITKANFNHGSHVTGIAAGKDLKTFKEQGIAIVLTTLIALVGTFVGSAVIAQLVMKWTGVF